LEVEELSDFKATTFFMLSLCPKTAFKVSTDYKGGQLEGTLSGFEPDDALSIDLLLFPCPAIDVDILGVDAALSTLELEEVSDFEAITFVMLSLYPFNAFRAFIGSKYGRFGGILNCFKPDDTLSGFKVFPDNELPG